MSIPGITGIPKGYVRIAAAEALEPFRFIKVSGEYADANEQMIGVTEVAWDSGDQASLIFAGIAIVETSEAVTAGNWLSADGSGKAKELDAAEATAGIALDTLTGAGFTRVLLAFNN